MGLLYNYINNSNLRRNSIFSVESLCFAPPRPKPNQVLQVHFGEIDFVPGTTEGLQLMMQMVGV